LEDHAPRGLWESFKDAHDWIGYSVPIEDHDGSTPLDAVVAEALRRADLVLRRAHGLRSPPQDAWAKKIAAPIVAQERVGPRIKAALSAASYPMEWQQFAALVLPECSEDMRRRCWLGYRATLEVRPNSSFDRVVFDSQATPGDREAARVQILPDSVATHQISLRDAFSLAMPLYEYYQEHGVSLRQKIARSEGRKGGRKTQRRRKKTDREGGIAV
jgi:hypothetical protein